jgi:hypothetical protein
MTRYMFPENAALALSALDLALIVGPPLAQELGAHLRAGVSACVERWLGRDDGAPPLSPDASLRGGYGYFST